MYCPQCGSVNDDSAAFCTKCGFNLEEHRKQWQEPATAGQPQGSDEAGGQAAPPPAVYPPTADQPPAAAYPPPYPQQYPPTHQAPPYQTPPPGYQPGAYQPAGYQPYNYGTVPRIPSYMGWAIATLILCFWPTGIVAVVYASKVGNRLALGDIPGAQEASRKAKMWSWITFAIAVAGVILAIIISIIAATVAVDSITM